SRWGLPSQPVTRLLVGSYIKGLAPPHHFTLTAPGVIPGAAVSFCCTFPVLRRPRNLSRAHLGRWALPTTASCGARTFLPPVARALVGLAVAAPAARAQAQEDDKTQLEFVRRLRERHMSKLALEYLDRLAKTGSPAVKKLVPVEVARTKITMARELEPER